MGGKKKASYQLLVSIIMCLLCRAQDNEDGEENILGSFKIQTSLFS